MVLVRMREFVTESSLIGGGRDVGVTGSLRRTTVELEVVVVWEMMTRGVWGWSSRRSDRTIRREEDNNTPPVSVDYTQRQDKIQ